MNHVRILPQPRKTPRALVPALAVFLLFLAIPLETHAFAHDKILQAVASLIGSVLEMTASFLGWAFVKVTHVLVNWLAPYNNFIGLSPPGHPVEVGWVIVRDLSNMFFIIILLVIAFGTIFRVEKYNYKQHLPRLLVMAVFINFSRTFTGLVIDAAQVGMLTFVNAFQAAAGGNLITGLGIQNLFQLSDNAGAVTAFKAIVSYMLANVFLVFALLTVVVIAVTLAVRIVMLWMITILSPAAFLLSTFPRGEQYYSRWWDQLICWAFSGPILAFFLWLALATMVTAGNDVANSSTEPPAGETTEAAVGGTPETSFATEAGKEQNIVRFIIGIVMLLFGVQVGQEFCAVAPGIVSGTASWMKGKGVGAAKAVGRLGARGALAAGKAPFKAGGAAIKAGAGWADYKLGIRKKAYGTLGKFAPGFAADRLAKLQQAPSAAYDESLKASAAAAAAAPGEFIRLANRKPLAQMPQGDAEYAARLKTAITDRRVYDSLVEQNGGDHDAAQGQIQTWYNEYEAAAGRSGNKDVIAGLKDVQKENPHFIQDDTKVKDIVSRMGAGDALKMSAGALKDPRVFAALSEGAKNKIKTTGSDKQRENLAAAEGTIAEIDALDAAGVEQMVQTRGEAAKKTLTAFYDRIKKRDPNVATAVLRQGGFDTASLKAGDLSKDNGAFAAELAANAHPDTLAAISTRPELAADMRAGLMGHRVSRNPAGAEDARIAEALIMAGASADEAFRNPDQLRNAVGGTRGDAVLRALGPDQIKKDDGLRNMLAESMSNERLFAMATNGGADLETARTIAQEVVKRSKKVTERTLTAAEQAIEDAINDRAAELQSDDTYRRMFKVKIS